MSDKLKSEIRALRENSYIAHVGSVNEEGYPQMKAMMVLEHASIREHYFSTNTSSKRVVQFLKNPKASVYYCRHDEVWSGALFTGTMEVCTDRETKAKLWVEKAVLGEHTISSWDYYPKGIDDEDYCVLKFTAQTVNCYSGYEIAAFPIEDV